MIRPNVLTFAAALAAAPALLAQEAQRLDLKVLYVGVPGDARTQDWQQFLAAHTEEVSVADVEQFGEQDAAGWHVVILDCPNPIVREGGRPTRIDVPRPKQLTASFDRPTVVVGGMALLTDGLQLKSNWL